MIQYRPSGSDGKHYAPERDLLSCGPKILHLAMAAMEPQWQEPWYRDFLKSNGIETGDLARAVMAFGRAMNSVMSSRDFSACLDKSGFTACKPAAQMAVLAKVGQSFIGATWSAVRQGNDMDIRTNDAMGDILRVAQQAVDMFANPKADDDN